MSSLPSVLSTLRSWAGDDRERGDGQLLRRFLQSGDEAAFSALLHRHGPMVLGVCRRVLRDPAELEDVFQATFLVLLRRAGSIRRQDALGSWLHGVAHRLARRARADGLRRRQHELRAGSRSPEETRPSHDDLRPVLDEEVARLPEKYRDPVVLCCLEGKTLAEAARLLGWKDGTVAGRLARGRALLADRLGRRGITPAGAVAGAVAAVPPELLCSTVRLVALSADAAGQAGVLANGLMRSLWVKKLAVAGGLLLSVCLAAGAAAAVRHALPVPRDAVASAPEAAPPRLDSDGAPLPAEAIARFGSTRLKHWENYISSLHLTPDGKTLVSVSSGEARVWDVATGRQLRQLPKEVYPGDWHGTALSPDGKVLATPLADQMSVCLWDLATGKAVRTFGNGRHTRVRFSPDGKLLVSEGGPRFQILSIWEPATGKLVRSWELEAGAECATPTVFTPDGKTVILAHRDGTLRFWEVDTGKEAKRIALGVSPRNVVASADGKLVAVTADEFKGNHVHLIDVAGRKVASKLFAPDRADEHGNKMRYTEVAFTPDGKTLLAAGIDDDLLFLDVDTGKERRRIKGGFTNLFDMALSRDGKTLVSALQGKVIKLTELTTGRDLVPITGHTVGVWGARFAAGGKVVATIGGGDDVFTWDAQTGRELRRLKGHTAAVTWLGVSDRGEILSHGYDKATRFWDPLTGKEVRRIDREDAASTPQLAPDGRSYLTYLHASERDLPSGVRSVDAATKKERWRWKAPRDGVGARFTPDGKTIVVRMQDQTIFVLDAATGEERTQYKIEGGRTGPGRGYAAYALALSNEGTLLGYGNQDRSLLVLETATGRVVHRLTDLPDGVSAIAFTPDDRMLAWGGWRSPPIHLIELATGKERHAFPGTSGRVLTLSFSPDGRMLLSGSEDTTAVAWDVAGRPRDGGRAIDRDAAWVAFAGDDAAKAYRQMRQLAASPKESVPYLRGKLKPVPAVDKDRVKRLIADLDSDAFEVRESAFKELVKMGEGVLGPCEAALVAKPPLEVRRRLEAVVRPLRVGRDKPSPEQLRAVRALEALEACGTAEARASLETLAKGAEGAPLTEHAKAALGRLGKLGPRR